MVQRSDDVTALVEQVKDVLPLLSVNLDLTYQAYMQHNVSNGAYQAVLRRHAMAIMLTEPDKHFLPDISSDMLFGAAAPLFVDLRHIAEDLAGDPKRQAEEKMERLHKLFVDHGFTAENPVLHIPAKPSVP